MLAGAPGAGVAQRPGYLSRAASVEAARLGDDLAVTGHDIAGGATADDADVGRRPLVEPAQLHVRDRRGGSGDRAVAVLRPNAGVSLDAGEISPHALLGRRGDDHLADRAGVIEDEAALGTQPARIEGLGAAQTLLLGDGQQQLDADRRWSVGPRIARHQLHEDRNRRLVVGAQDRLAGAAEDAI